MSETIPPNSSGGLRGQSAGSTAICTVGKSGVGLTYRGYAIEELAEHATFEEVAFLLLEGTLPDQQQLAGFRKRLRAFRFLPPALREVLERIPKTRIPWMSCELVLPWPEYLSLKAIFHARTGSRSGFWPLSHRSFATGIGSVTTEAHASN